MGDVAKKQRGVPSTLTKPAAAGTQHKSKTALYADKKQGDNISKQKQEGSDGLHAAASLAQQQASLLALAAKQDWSVELDIPEPSIEEVEHGIAQLLTASAHAESRALTQDLMIEQHALDAQITACPNARAAFLGGLTRVRLDRLQLTGINEETLQAMPQLTHIFLQHNRISNMQPLARLHNLQLAVLSHNQISQVEGVAGLPQLMLLDISHNHISNLDVTRLPTSSLRFLKLEGNPCMCGPAAAAVRQAVIQLISQLRDLDGPLDDNADGSDGASSSEEGSVTVIEPMQDFEEGLLRATGSTGAATLGQAVAGSDGNSVDRTSRPFLGLNAASLPASGQGQQWQPDSVTASWDLSAGLGTLNLNPLTGIGSHLNGSVNGGAQFAAQADTTELNTSSDKVQGSSGSRQLQTAMDMLEWLERGCVDSSMTALMASLQVNKTRASDAFRTSAVGLSGYGGGSRPGSAAPGAGVALVGAGSSRPTTPLLHTQQQQQQQTPVQLLQLQQQKKTPQQQQQQRQQQGKGQREITVDVAAGAVSDVQQDNRSASGPCPALGPSAAAATLNNPASTQVDLGHASQGFTSATQPTHALLRPLSRQTSNTARFEAGKQPVRNSMSVGVHRPSSATTQLPGLESRPGQEATTASQAAALLHRLSAPLGAFSSSSSGVKNQRSSRNQARSIHGAAMDLEQQIDQDLEQLQARLQALIEPLAAAAALVRPDAQETQRAGTADGSITSTANAHPADLDSHHAGASDCGNHDSTAPTSHELLASRPSTSTALTAVCKIAATATGPAGSASSGTRAAPPSTTRPAGLAVQKQIGQKGARPLSTVLVAASAAGSKAIPAARASTIPGKPTKQLASASGTAAASQQVGHTRPSPGKASIAGEQGGVVPVPGGQLQKQDVHVASAMKSMSAEATMQAHTSNTLSAGVHQQGRQDLHHRMDRIMGAAAARVAEQRAAQQQLALQLRAMRMSSSLAKELKSHLSLKVAMAAGPGVVAAVRGAAVLEASGTSGGLDPGIVQQALERHQLAAAIKGPDGLDSANASSAAAGAGFGASDDASKLRVSLARLEKLSTLVMLEHGADVEALRMPPAHQIQHREGSIGDAAAAGSAVQATTQQAASRYHAVLARMAAAPAQGMSAVEEDEEEEEEEVEFEKSKDSSDVLDIHSRGLSHEDRAGNDDSASEDDEEEDTAGSLGGPVAQARAAGSGDVAAASVSAGSSAYQQIIARAASQRAHKQDAVA